MKIFYYVPNMNSPSGGMGVLMKQAVILSENGYDVTFIYEGPNDFNPIWMDFNIDSVKKQRINGILNFRAKDEDILVIPEGFGILVEQTKNVNYKRVVLAQSYAYILDSLKDPKQFWDKLNIKHVISVSEGITEYIESITDKLKIHTYKQSINTDLFKPSEKQYSVVYSCSRGEEQRSKTLNAIRYFQALTPKYANLFKFIELKGLSRKDFAKVLSEATFCLYTDEIAGFGTLPLEAMACETVVIGFQNMGNKEYAYWFNSEDEYNAYWCHNGNYQTLGFRLVDAVKDLIENDGIEVEYIKNVGLRTVVNYNQEQEKESILRIFNDIINEK